MKTSRLLMILLTASAAMAFTSCSNDDDLPEVNLTVNYSGATEHDGTLYVVAGDNLKIDGLSVKPINSSKAATLGATAYYWDYQYIGTTVVEPFGLSIDTSLMPPGNYILQINTTIFQVDKSVGIAYILYPVVIVPDSASLPDGVQRSAGGTLAPDMDIRAGAAPSR